MPKLILIGINNFTKNFLVDPEDNFNFTARNYNQINYEKNLFMRCTVLCFSIIC